MLENWDNWTAGEREMFRSTCRRLMKHTFLVRDRDEDSRTRYFWRLSSESKRRFWI